MDYVPDQDIQIMFRCRKPDDHSVLLDSSFLDTERQRYLITRNADGTILVELIDQVTPVPGRCYCDICLVKSNQVLSSLPFTLSVVPSPRVEDRLASTDDFKIVASVLEYARNMEKGALQSICTLTLSDNWRGEASPYVQNVTVSGYLVTANTKVDLYGNATTITKMIECGTAAIYVQNDNGTLTVYAVGERPTGSITLQAGIYETVQF